MRHVWMHVWMHVWTTQDTTSRHEEARREGGMVCRPRSIVRSRVKGVSFKRSLVPRPKFLRAGTELRNMVQAVLSSVGGESKTRRGEGAGDDSSWEGSDLC